MENTKQNLCWTERGRIKSALAGGESRSAIFINFLSHMKILKQKASESDVAGTIRIN